MPEIPSAAVMVGVADDNGAPDSAGALRFAVAEAVRRRVGLRLVHVAPPVPLLVSDGEANFRYGLALLWMISAVARISMP